MVLPCSFALRCVIRFFFLVSIHFLEYLCFSSEFICFIYLILIAFLATMPGDLYRLYAIASIRCCVCVFANPMYLAVAALNHRFMLPMVRSALYLVLLMICLNFACHTVSGLFFAALCMILSLNPLSFNACLLAADA